MLQLRSSNPNPRWDIQGTENADDRDSLGSDWSTYLSVKSDTSGPITISEHTNMCAPEKTVQDCPGPGFSVLCM